MNYYLMAIKAIVIQAFNEQRTYRTQMVLTAVSTIVGLVQFGILGSFLRSAQGLPGMERYGNNIVGFIVVGSMFSGIFMLAMSSPKRAIQEEQIKGTLEMLACSRLGIVQYSIIVSCISLFTSLAISLGICYIFATLFGFTVKGNFFDILAIALLGLSALGAVGMCAAGYILVSKKGEPFTWAISLLSGLFSGVLYPVQIFPTWLQSCAYILPVTGLLDAMRLVILEGRTLSSVMDLLWSPIAFTLIGAPIGIYTLKVGLQKARYQATIGNY